MDDNIETIRKRFKVFVESSLPVVAYYEKLDKVHKVIGLSEIAFSILFTVCYLLSACCC